MISKVLRLAQQKDFVMAAMKGLYLAPQLVDKKDDLSALLKADWMAVGSDWNWDPK